MKNQLKGFAGIILCLIISAASALGSWKAWSAMVAPDTGTVMTAVCLFATALLLMAAVMAAALGLAASVDWVRNWAALARGRERDAQFL